MTERERSNTRTVTALLNDAHLSAESTLGSPTGIALQGSPLVPSLNFSSAYAFDTIDRLGAYHEDKFNSVRYARDSSLIVLQLESYFKRIFQADVILFNSGMSAINAVLRAAINSDSLVYTLGSYYRKTATLLSELASNFGVKHKHVHSVEELLACGNTDSNITIHIESPSNPFLRLADVESVRASFPNAFIIYDNTFQGLLNDKGQTEFADVVVGSCTKYIGGHNDLLAGYVSCSSHDLYHKIWSARSNSGGIPDNLSAYLLFRSLRTYDVRLERSLKNCEEVLRFLEKTDSIDQIYYPGRYGNADQSELFNRSQFHGGSVLTFRASNGTQLEDKFSQLKSTKMAPSFGSVDTLVEIPAYMSHWGKDSSELEKLGLDFKTIRLSVGNEPVSYIIDDLKMLLS